MRLLALTEEQLDASQRALYERILSGPRANGTQHFPLVDHRGALTGPFGIMLHAPALGEPLQDLGSAIRYKSGLTARVREIAILSVAAATSSAFERYAHERVGRAVGLTDDELDQLARGAFVSDDPLENRAYRLCEILIANELPIDEEAYADLLDVLDEEAVIELTVLVGYYRMLAQLLHVFDVGIPTD